MPDPSNFRVLWVIPTISSRFGGPTTTAVNGVIAEKRAGMHSELISTVSEPGEPDSAPATRRLIENGISVRLFPRTGLISKGEAWGLSPRMALWLVRNLRSYDVIHLQYVWCMSSIVGALLAAAFKVPLVISPHESLTAYDIDIASKSRIKRRVKLLLKRLYLATANRLVFMSELERSDTDSGDTPAEIINHAVLEHESSPPRRQAASKDVPLRIAFLGRNIDKKGIDLIIGAMAEHRERDWSLMIAGPPGTDDFVAKTKALTRDLGVDQNVSWLGFLDNRSVLFNRCDVLAMPSAYEGFGMVSAEAMCAAVPVIVPRRSGVAELVHEYDGGIVMPESSVQHLADALLEMDEDPEGSVERGGRGLQAANERLTYSAYAASTLTLYENLTRVEGT